MPALRIAQRAELICARCILASRLYCQVRMRRTAFKIQSATNEKIKMVRSHLGLDGTMSVDEVLRVACRQNHVRQDESTSRSEQV